MAKSLAHISCERYSKSIATVYEEEIQMKKVLFLCLFPILLLTACGNQGKLDEGDCRCKVYFTDIPREFTMLDENLREDFEIHVTLENLTTEKAYRITLDQENDYSLTAKLHPGVYKVAYIYASMQNFTAISVSSKIKQIELTRDNETEIPIFVDNKAEFTKHWMAVQPMPEMILADKYSGLIQINRKVISIAHILPELSISDTSQVNPQEKIQLTDTERGIVVTVQNRTDKTQSWQNCDVLGIRVNKNTVVFPDGVTLGMAPEKVCHNAKGLYGEPSRLSGSILYGWDFDTTSAIYLDSISGNKITIGISSDGSRIYYISYELAVFE